MAITVNFDIPMPNEPYVDDFSDGNTHAAVYKGDRFIKVERRISDGMLGAIVDEAATEAELTDVVNPREGWTHHVMDAETNPLQVAYLNGMYTTGDVADYTEDLGTTDENGDAESWTYYYNDETGCIGQIYLHGTLRYVDGAYVGPDFRAHAVSRESFLETVPNQSAMIQAEIDSGKYSAEKVTELTAYKTWLENVPTKYANVKHWKIPFPPYPEVE